MKWLTEVTHGGMNDELYLRQRKRLSVQIKVSVETVSSTHHFLLFKKRNLIGDSSVKIVQSTCPKWQVAYVD